MLRHEVVEVLETRAQNIASRYKLSFDEVLEVLKRTVQEIDKNHPRWQDDPLFQKKVDLRLYHEPNFSEALHYLFPFDALRLFKGTNLNRLTERVRTTKLLLERDTPLYTHQELADLIDSFILHLRKNEGALLKTGLPKTCFLPCPLLEKNLNKIYYTRLPVIFLAHEWCLAGIGTAKRVRQGSDGIEGYDDSGNPVYNHVWTRNQVVPTMSEEGFGLIPSFVKMPERESIRILEPPLVCEQSDSPLIQGLGKDDAERLETLRPKVLTLKINVLRILQGGVSRQDASGLWPACLDEIVHVLSTGEGTFLLRMDRFYRICQAGHLRAASLRVGGVPPENPNCLRPLR